MKKKCKTEEFISLNREFHSEFSIQELELRLETDPLLFVDFFQQSNASKWTCDVPGNLTICGMNGDGTTFNECTTPEGLIA